MSKVRAGTAIATPAMPAANCPPNGVDATRKSPSSEKPHAIEALLHPRDAAKLLTVSTSGLAKSRLAGTGPRYVKIGRAVRYPEASLREFIKSRMRGSTSER
jgi:hypothetical protein